MTEPSSRQTLWRPYTQMKTAPPPLEVVATEGVRIHLTDGRVLIDGVASWWTACHGYNHPHIRQAVEAQLGVLPHVMFGGLTHAPAERLGARLAELLPADLNHVFFTDSGSVAVEVAMKMAVQSWINRGVTGRDRFVSFVGGYHGDTLGAMSVCDPEDGMHATLGAYVPAQILANLPRTAEQTAALDALLGSRRHEIAAVILEPLVQGAGGMIFHSAEVLQTVAALCRKHGLLLILDEIMTGFGRTGSMFACQQAGIVPDIICLSKALTGGTLPLAATVASSAVFDSFWSDSTAAALMHGPTFMANAMACAAANASLDLFEAEDCLAKVAGIERQLATELAPCRGLPGIADVRVKGAIGVVEFDHTPNVQWLRRDLVSQGAWVRPFGRVLYLAPAFSIPVEELRFLTAAVCATASRWTAQS